MIDVVPTVPAQGDPGWGGVWAACPHCEHENEVDHDGRKICRQCGMEFIVEPGPLVLNLKQPGMPVLQNSDDLPS